MLKKILFYLFLFSSLQAQEQFSTPKPSSLIKNIFGSAPVDCIYLGMITYHMEKRWRDRNDNWNNQALGVQYKSMFVTTLVNSHYNRSYTFGITRDWIKFQPSKNTKVTFGYRLGGIYGYGAELNKWAEISPVLPIYQVCSQVQYKRLRLEFSYFRHLLSAYLTVVYGEF